MKFSKMAVCCYSIGFVCIIACSFIYYTRFAAPHFYSGRVYARYISDKQPALLELYATDFNRGWWLISLNYRENANSPVYDHEVVFSKWLWRNEVEVSKITNGVAIIPPKCTALEIADEYENMWQFKINFEQPLPIINNWVFDTPEYKEALRCHEN